MPHPPPPTATPARTQPQSDAQAHARTQTHAQLHARPHVRTQAHGWTAAQNWTLVLPALGAWSSALILLGCPPLTGFLVTAACALAALTLHRRPTTRRSASRLLLARGSAAGYSVPGHPEPGRPEPGHPTTDHRAARRAPSNLTILTTLAAVAATSTVVALNLLSISSGPLPALTKRGATITAQLVLTDDPKIRSPRPGSYFHRDQIVVTANLRTLITGSHRLAMDIPVRLYAFGPGWRTLLPSQRIEVTARLAPADPSHLTAATLLARTEPRVLSPPSWIHRIAGDLRAGLRNAADVLPPDQRGLLPGLVVGDVSRMDPQVAADFRDAGLTHLLAVSGANLAIVAGAVLVLGRVAGLSLPARAVLAAAAMIAFAVVARPSPSVLRALVMGLVAVTALGTGRTKDGITALSASVVILILFEPALARSYERAS